MATTELEANGIGSLFLRDILATAQEITVAVHRELPFLLPAATSRRRVLHSLLTSFAARLPGFHGIRLRWFRRQLLPARVTAIVEAAKQQGADRIWITTSSPEMIWVGEQLASSGWDIRVMVWDAPEYLAQNLRLANNMTRSLQSSFGNLLRQAQRVSVVGQAMQREYERLYGVTSDILRHCVHPPTRTARSPYPEGAPIRIVFAGSLYSKAEWNSFIEALETCHWRMGGRPVVLYFMGRFPLAGARRPNAVIFLSERSFAEAQEILLTMDVGYLPYWFDPRREIAARTSFPGKLSAYAAAGLAIFHHAPSYTEVTSFLKVYPFGLACASLAPNEVIDALERLIQKIGSDAYVEARRKALSEELSPDLMGQRFRQFLTGRKN